MDGTQAQRRMERVKAAILAAGFTEAGAVDTGRYHWFTLRGRSR